MNIFTQRRRIYIQSDEGLWHILGGRLVNTPNKKDCAPDTAPDFQKYCAPNNAPHFHIGVHSNVKVRSVIGSAILLEVRSGVGSAILFIGSVYKSASKYMP